MCVGLLAGLPRHQVIPSAGFTAGFASANRREPFLSSVSKLIGFSIKTFSDRGDEQTLDFDRRHAGTKNHFNRAHQGRLMEVTQP